MAYGNRCSFMCRPMCTSQKNIKVFNLQEQLIHKKCIIKNDEINKVTKKIPNTPDSERYSLGLAVLLLTAEGLDHKTLQRKNLAI